ncbi:hypothetical protein F8388_005213 [Cannabis sativa]|uniref:Reverse transcriptase zinc-binding domain-containing protein n=1 Tax=Cannabis sativa TaxID=3483 RepID=A0A7J6EL50_CANSA|nr:hypothetical protein F8388_005213 [Cannabis sativa]KAF4375045.1 hypothetical protein G4B88_004796 [Cannabis sativa]
MTIYYVLWRAASNCLPTRKRLFDRKVPLDYSCPFCLVSSETIAHCLLHCDFAAGCWLRMGLGVGTRVWESFKETTIVQRPAPSSTNNQQQNHNVTSNGLWFHSKPNKRDNYSPKEPFYQRVSSLKK